MKLESVIFYSGILLLTFAIGIYSHMVYVWYNSPPERICYF